MTKFLQRSPAIVIAEIGVNHNGDLDIARELVLAARDAGADYAKFQTFRAEELVTPEAGVADYQRVSVGEISQRDMLTSLQLSHQDFRDLKSFCETAGIGFLTTAHDFESMEFVFGLNLDFIKVPSGDLTNRPFLESVGKQGTPILLSTGMGTYKEVEDALEVLEGVGLDRDQVTVLQCTTNYPAPLEEANVLAMVEMGKRLSVPVGYSDHTSGSEAALAAVALGARVIEKHFTLDKSLPGPDHAASADIAELQGLVQRIRSLEIALGSPEKNPSPTEAPNRLVVRKSLVALRSIQRGEIFSSQNVGVKRPGTGISPMLWHDVIGTVAHRSFSADDLIELS